MRLSRFTLSALILSGCTAGGSNFEATAQQVVESTRNLCNFAPLTTSVLSLLGAPGAPAADELVDSICDEVKKVNDAGFVEPGTEATLTVLGMPVVGEFVN